jgi:hypothetical protein
MPEFETQEERAKFLASLIVFASVRANNGSYVQTIKVPNTDTYETVLFPHAPKFAKSVAEAILVELYIVPWTVEGKPAQAHTLEEAEAQHNAAIEFLAGAPDIRESLATINEMPPEEQNAYLFTTSLMLGTPWYGSVEEVKARGVVVDDYRFYPEPVVV